MVTIPRHIAKPARYLGLEPYAVFKEPAGRLVRFALCYPDIYDIGMSYHGLFLLYGLANSLDGVWCERCFAPWTDMEELLRTEGRLLATLESRTPLRDMDLVGFSLTYELNITNVLNMLRLAGIPWRARERTEGMPLVIAGGPLTLNPRPFEAFFDLIVVGEGEAPLTAMLDVMKEMKGDSRLNIVEAMAGIEGVYSPLVPGRTVKRVYVEDLDTSYHPVRPPLPVVGSVHNRFSVEVSRGCGNGCRFCLAGFGYRPYRERSLGRVTAIIDEALEGTGFEEVSFLSLTAGDYTFLFEALRYVKERYPGVSVSLPSLKIGTIGEAEIGLMGSMARTGFTFALEAATDKLRRRINKNIDVEGLLRLLPLLRKEGWRKLKLYLMVGFPWEESADMEGLKEVFSVFRRSGIEVSLSVSPFIPKPHTPFQWLGMEDGEALQEKLRAVKAALKGKGVKVRYRDVATSMVEAVVARGDERLTGLFEYLAGQGVRLEAWRECFRVDAYLDWFERKGMTPSLFTGPRDLDAVLPWDFVETGVTVPFLRHEYERAGQGRSTENCLDGCAGCGLGCRAHDGAEPQTGGLPAAVGGKAADDRAITVSGQVPEAPDSAASGRKVTFLYTKMGDARYIGHLDTASVLLRAIRAAGIPIRMHGKFHPLPKMSMSPALPVGVESTCEMIEIETEHHYAVDGQAVERINRGLPRGMRIREWEAKAIKEMAKPSVFMVISVSEIDHEGLEPVDRAGRPFYIWTGPAVKELLARKEVRRIVKIESGKAERWRRNLSSM
jgi:radical SAM family uncharacterized protein